MKQNFKVTGMTCAVCARRVEDAARGVDGAVECHVNLLTKELSVIGAVAEEDVVSAVRNAGYGIVKSNTEDNSEKKDGLLLRMRMGLIASSVLTVLLMYFSMGHMLHLPTPEFLSYPLNNGILQMVVALSVMAINYRFFKNGVNGIIHKAPNMDTLVSLGSLVSFVFSIFVLFSLDNSIASHPGGLYFDSAAMILTLISVGKLLEEMAKKKTTGAVEELIALTPKTCAVLVNGEERILPIEEVKVGDVFVVRPGESIATDAVVISGNATVDESMLSGESVPVYRSEGDTVYGSTVNKSGFLTCRAVSVGEETAIASIIAMVKEATSSKAPIARVADKVAGVFVPLVLLLSAITFTLWTIITGEIEYAVSHAIAILVISCPCALGLATPVAIMVGTGLAAKRGILFKNAEAEETSARIRTVVLDKTGTVTGGEMTVKDVYLVDTDESHLLETALALEAKSEHPIARAIVRYCEERSVKLDSEIEFENLEGRGVVGIRGDCKIMAVSLGYAESIGACRENERETCEGIASYGATPTLIVENGKCIGIIAVSDSPKKDAPLTVRYLKKRGYRVIMLTGDNRATAEYVARSVGIDEVIAEVLPSGKKDVITTLGKDGPVCMVGDGINDAPALASADVGIAIGCGTDVAIATADVVLMTGDLMGVAHALDIGKATLGTIKENLFFAFLYNLIGIPLAAGVFGVNLPPMFGALAMSLSSTSVVLNALRLSRHRPRGVCDCRVEAELPEYPSQGLNNENNENNIDNEKETHMTKVYNVEGMMCPHCEKRVKEAVEALPSVAAAIPSHKDGTLTVEFAGAPDDKAVTTAITAAGYEVK